MIKGVPIELQIAYNQNPEQYDLLGVMADAADDQGEGEVAEALRWFWSNRLKPHFLNLSGGRFLSAWEFAKGSGEEMKAVISLRPLVDGIFDRTPVEAVSRMVAGYSLWVACGKPPSTVTY